MRCLSGFAIALLVAGCGDDGFDPGADAGPATPVLYDDVYSSLCDAPPRCLGQEVLTACTCVPTPLPRAELELRRALCSELPSEGGEPRSPERDFCVTPEAGVDPDLGCFVPGGFARAGESQLVTVHGVVDVFGGGQDTNAVLVQIYAEGANGALGELLGSATTAAREVDDPCAETQLEHRAGEVVDERRLGSFAIEEIPSETPLIVKTSGNPGRWRPVYTYNVHVPNVEVQAAAPSDACATVAALPGPVWAFRPRILSASDWSDLPLEAGLEDGVRANAGVVAGEVRDCGDVRLQFARVGTSPSAAAVPYFQGDPDDPTLESSFGGTTALGGYAALDVAEGQVNVAALGWLGGETVSLGWYRARVFAGALTNVTFRGLRPHQVPAE